MSEFSDNLSPLRSRRACPAERDCDRRDLRPRPLAIGQGRKLERRGPTEIRASDESVPAVSLAGPHGVCAAVDEGTSAKFFDPLTYANHVGAVSMSPSDTKLRGSGTLVRGVGTISHHWIFTANAP